MDDRADDEAHRRVHAVRPRRAGREAEAVLRWNLIEDCLPCRSRDMVSLVSNYTAELIPPAFLLSVQPVVQRSHHRHCNLSDLRRLPSDDPDLALHLWNGILDIGDPLVKNVLRVDEDERTGLTFRSEGEGDLRLPCSGR